MYVVGLTGGIGSGKTTVANAFADLGVELIDADILSREAVAPDSEALAKIATEFGSELLTDSGELDRRQLRKIVFADESKRLWLEELLHPIIGQLIKDRIGRCTSEYCLLISPLLLETDQHQLVQRVLVIDVSEETQLQRTMARDDSDEATVRGIMQAQLSREKRLQAADDIVDNELPLSSMAEQVHQLHLKYQELAQSHVHN